MSDDVEDRFGPGGPVLLALGGKYLVAGFSNGTIARAPLLSDGIVDTPDMVTCVFSSFSCLPSDTMHCPLLDCSE